MALKTFKPYTKSSRGTILVDRNGLWKGKPYKPLTSVNNSLCMWDGIPFISLCAAITE